MGLDLNCLRKTSLSCVILLLFRNRHVVSALRAFTPAVGTDGLPPPHPGSNHLVFMYLAALAVYMLINVATLTVDQCCSTAPAGYMWLRIQFRFCKYM